MILIFEPTQCPAPGDHSNNSSNNAKNSITNNNTSIKKTMYTIKIMETLQHVVKKEYIP